MASITSRSALKDYCKRRLGFPVIDINVDDDQVEERIDEALEFFQQYHFDATEKVYILHYVSQTDIDRKYIDLSQTSGSANTIAGSNVVTGYVTNFSSELAANYSRITIGGENKLVTSVANNLSLTVDSVFAASNDYAPITNATDASAIIGVNKVYNVTDSNQTNNMFDMRYQMRLNDLYTFRVGSASYVNYVITQQHLRTINMLFTGETPLRFNRHQGRLYIDWQWGTDIQAGEYVMAECWKIVNPESFTLVYDDLWLKRYCTALIKRQWGQNLSKFAGIQLPGGISLNGPQILTEAVAEITELETQIQLRFEEPPEFLVG